MHLCNRLGLEQNGHAGPNGEPVAILSGGGLDSAILLGEMVRAGVTVHPIYVRCGLRWEQEEISHLQKFLAALAGPSLEPLQFLELPVADVYGDHWSVAGGRVPDARSPDDAVYLPGRNVLLLCKAMLWCHLRNIPRVALGSLMGNPFPDATAAFIRQFESLMGGAIATRVRIERPYASMTKAEVMLRGSGLPLELTFSCLAPVAGLHCGGCNKCAERRAAFQHAGLPDDTRYADIESKSPFGGNGATDEIGGNGATDETRIEHGR